MTIPEIKQLCKSIIELAEKASKGWQADADDPETQGIVFNVTLVAECHQPQYIQDAVFIAASRNVTPQMAKALLEVIELIEFTASDNPGTAQLLLQSIPTHFTN